MLEPDPRVRGPLPRLVRLLAAALREHDCEVHLERWGQHHDSETMWHKVRGRASDLATIRAELKQRPYDVLYVTTAHDWKTMGRDIPLLLTTRERGGGISGSGARPSALMAHTRSRDIGPQ